MGQAIPQADNRQQLIGIARQRAFDTYLRFGRWPETPSSAAERKAVDPASAVPAKATRFYVWRSAGDDKVRDSHAERNGQLFAWADPPAGGHPGTEPNCRCWAEPYYGDPAIPDALQPLRHDHQVDATGLMAWASIETLTRSDGSLAQSLVTARDGTQIRAEFAGTRVSRRVTLPTGETVRLDSSAGVQSVSIGDDPRPLFQSAWTARGPRVIRARQHVAFLGDAQTLIDPDVGADPAATGREPAVVTILPNVSGLLTLAFVSLYSMLQAAPASQGLSEGDEPVVVFRAWTVGPNSQPIPIFVDAMTAEQIKQTCTRLSDVQEWADEAVAVLETERPNLTEQTYGIRVHGYVDRIIRLKKSEFPLLYEDIHSEISFLPSGHPAYRGQTSSVRYDVYETVPPQNPELVCVFDIKTGDARIRFEQLTRMAASARASNPGAMILILEVHPNSNHGNGRR